MSTTRSTDKSITEGYLAGGASLLVAVAWTIFNAFHLFIILPLYIIAIFCLFLSTRWLVAEKKAKRHGV